MRRVILFFIFFSGRAARGGGGGRCQTFYFYFFPCSADHERNWPPCKVVFFGLATNALNLRNNKSTLNFPFNVSNSTRSRRPEMVSSTFYFKLGLFFRHALGFSSQRTTENHELPTKGSQSSRKFTQVVCVLVYFVTWYICFLIFDISI